jgi:hypothetical protein
MEIVIPIGVFILIIVRLLIAYERPKIFPEKRAITSVTKTEKALASQSGRQRKYLVAMVFRITFFLVTLVLPSPYRWFTLAGAVFLPYVAVFIANAGQEGISEPDEK